MPCTTIPPIPPLPLPPLLLLEPPTDGPGAAAGPAAARPNDAAERKLPVKLGGGNRAASYVYTPRLDQADDDDDVDASPFLREPLLMQLIRSASGTDPHVVTPMRKGASLRARSSRMPPSPRLLVRWRPIGRWR
jgi:hypothetical protein